MERAEKGSGKGGSTRSCWTIHWWIQFISELSIYYSHHGILTDLFCLIPHRFLLIAFTIRQTARRIRRMKNRARMIIKGISSCFLPHIPSVGPIQIETFISRRKSEILIWIFHLHSDSYYNERDTMLTDHSCWYCKYRIHNWEDKERELSYRSLEMNESHSQHNAY